MVWPFSWCPLALGSIPGHCPVGAPYLIPPDPGTSKFDPWAWPCFPTSTGLGFPSDASFALQRALGFCLTGQLSACSKTVFEEDGTLAKCEHLFQQAPNFLPNPAFLTKALSPDVVSVARTKGGQARALLFTLSE